jgi:hypothetical protein
MIITKEKQLIISDAGHSVKRALPIPSASADTCLFTYLSHRCRESVRRLVRLTVIPKSVLAPSMIKTKPFKINFWLLKTYFNVKIDLKKIIKL